MFVPISIVILVGFIFILMIGMIIRLAHKRDPLLGDQRPTLRPTRLVPPRGPSTAPFAKLSPDMEVQVRALIAAGRKIDAIKLTREITHLGLKESKDFVDTLG